MSIASLLLTKVETALSSGELAPARAAVDDAVRVDGTNPDVLTALARVQGAEGHLGEAEATLRRAVAHSPRHPGAKGFLGALLLGTGRAEEARPLLQEAVLAGPAHPAVKLAWGRLLLESGELSRSLPFLQQAAAEGPSLPQAHRVLGQAMLRAGDEGQAAQAFARAVQLKPTDLASWAGLIRARLSSDPAHARELLAEARRHNPGPDGARLAVELSLDAQDAAGALAALAELGPGERDAEDDVVHAWILMQLGRWPEAVVAARSAVERDPRHWRAQYTLGMARESEEPMDRQAVEAAYRAAIMAGDPRGEAGTRLGFLLLESEGGAPRTDEAIEVLEAAKSRSGDAPGPMLNLAIAYRQKEHSVKVAALASAILAHPGASASEKDQAERLRRSL